MHALVPVVLILGTFDTELLNSALELNSGVSMCQFQTDRPYMGYPME